MSFVAAKNMWGAAKGVKKASGVLSLKNDSSSGDEESTGFKKTWAVTKYYASKSIKRWILPWVLGAFGVLLVIVTMAAAAKESLGPLGDLFGSVVGL